MTSIRYAMIFGLATTGTHFRKGRGAGLTQFAPLEQNWLHPKGQAVQGSGHAPEKRDHPQHNDRDPAHDKGQDSAQQRVHFAAKELVDH